MPAKMIAHGTSSDMSLDASIVWVMTIVGGRLTRARFFASRDEALAAVGT